MSNKPSLSCRGCLTKVTANDSYSFAWQEIKDLFVDCTSIQISSHNEQDLPHQICSECYSKCDQWYAFRKMCQEVNQHLQRTLPDVTYTSSKPQFTIKDEPEEYYEAVSDIETSDYNQEAYTLNQSVDPVEQSLFKIFHPDGTSGTDHLLTPSSSMEFDEFESRKKQLTMKTEKLVKGPPVDSPLTEKKSNLGPFTCPVCYKEFSCATPLHSHFVVHTSEIPYVCKYCQLAFTMRCNVHTHIRINHPNRSLVGGILIEEGSIFAGPRPWEAFVQSSSLSSSVAAGSFQTCNQCQAVCQSYGELKEHIRQQHKPRQTHPYACNYCGNSFRKRNNLFCHIKRCHGWEKQDAQTLLNQLKGHRAPRSEGVRLFSCEYCGKTYMKRKGLVHHRKNHH